MLVKFKKTETLEWQRLQLEAISCLNVRMCTGISDEDVACYTSIYQIHLHREIIFSSRNVFELFETFFKVLKRKKIRIVLEI